MVLKLIFRILILACIILLISYSGLYLNPDYKKEYVAGIISKLEKLKDVEVKKIVIIGGSNASFGVDTDLMERQLGVPVINMALHGGIPVKFIVEQVKPFMDEDDILIFSKEYEGLRDRDWNRINGTEISKVATYDISNIKVLLSDQTLFETSVSNIFNTIKEYVKLHPIKGRQGVTSVYDSRAFRKDNLLPEFVTGKYGLEVKQHELKKLDKNSEVLKGLKEYKDYFENKGVKFYLTPPVIIKEYFEEDKILPFWHFFSDQTGIPMLNWDKKYSFEKEYFFNSHYHPNYIGRELRTKSLIEDLITLGLVPEGQLKLNRTLFVAKKENRNKAILESFEKPYHFDILERNKQEIRVKQSGNLDHNYFRIKFENENLNGHQFYLHLECDREVLENIRFRGAGPLVEFDSIIDYGNNNYGLWKKANKVYYKNGNSYLGISFPDKKELTAKEFVVKDVGVYKDFAKNDLYIERFSIVNKEDGVLFFEIISDKSKVRLNDIAETNGTMVGVELKANQLYKIEKKNGRIRFEDFYKGKTVYETTNEISFKNSPKKVIKVYD